MTTRKEDSEVFAETPPARSRTIPVGRCKREHRPPSIDIYTVTVPQPRVIDRQGGEVLRSYLGG